MNVTYLVCVLERADFIFMYKFLVNNANCRVHYEFINGTEREGRTLFL